jgi:hypothetical protein
MTILRPGAERVRQLRQSVRELEARYRTWHYQSPSRLAQFLREEAGAVGDVAVKYGASASLTFTLASLATSATRVAGRASTAIGTSGLITDALVGGKITTGTTPTANTQIDVWVYGALDDTPTYPDTITGSDAAATLSGTYIRDAELALATTIVVDSATSDVTRYVRPFSVAQLFGGVLPKNWGLFISHNTGVNLNATGSNHAFKYTPVYYNVAAS